MGDQSDRDDLEVVRQPLTWQRPQRCIVRIHQYVVDDSGGAADLRSGPQLIQIPAARHERRRHGECEVPESRQRNSESGTGQMLR